MAKKQKKKATDRQTVLLEESRPKKAKSKVKPVPQVTVEKLRKLAGLPINRRRVGTKKI